MFKVSSYPAFFRFWTTECTNSARITKKSISRDSIWEIIFLLIFLFVVVQMSSALIILFGWKHPLLNQPLWCNQMVWLEVDFTKLGNYIVWFSILNFDKALIHWLKPIHIECWISCARGTNNTLKQFLSSSSKKSQDSLLNNSEYIVSRFVRILEHHFCQFVKY